MIERSSVEDGGQTRGGMALPRTGGAAWMRSTYVFPKYTRHDRDTTEDWVGRQAFARSESGPELTAGPGSRHKRPRFPC